MPVSCLYATDEARDSRCLAQHVEWKWETASLTVIKQKVGRLFSLLKSQGTSLLSLSLCKANPLLALASNQHSKHTTMLLARNKVHLEELYKSIPYFSFSSSTNLMQAAIASSLDNPVGLEMGTNKPETINQFMLFFFLFSFLFFFLTW